MELLKSSKLWEIGESIEAERVILPFDIQMKILSDYGVASKENKEAWNETYSRLSKGASTEQLRDLQIYFSEHDCKASPMDGCGACEQALKEVRELGFNESDLHITELL